jgi:hypothetical protein
MLCGLPSLFAQFGIRALLGKVLSTNFRASATPATGLELPDARAVLRPVKAWPGKAAANDKLAATARAGYIDARPHQPRSTKPLAPHGRTIHWVKVTRTRGEHISSVSRQ